MRIVMTKFYSSIIIGCLVVLLSGPVQFADAAKVAMHVSNRIKIVRPGASQAAPIAEAPVSPPAGMEVATVSAPSADQASPIPPDRPIEKAEEKPSVAGAPIAVSQADQPVPTQQAPSDQKSSVTLTAPPTVQTAEGQAAIPAGGGAAPAAAEAAVKSEFASLMGLKERLYVRKGRVDPFEPFLRQPEPEVTPETQPELNRRVPQTPLEKIELSQLKLTAVLRTPTKTRALVQEGSGKGYVIEEGTYIGNKGGQVSKILKDRITVAEKALDVFGKITVMERELKLQP